MAIKAVANAHLLPAASFPLRRSLREGREYSPAVLVKPDTSRRATLADDGRSISFV